MSGEMRKEVGKGAAFVMYVWDVCCVYVVMYVCMYGEYVSFVSHYNIYILPGISRLCGSGQNQCDRLCLACLGTSQIRLRCLLAPIPTPANLSHS